MRIGGIEVPRWCERLVVAVGLIVGASPVPAQFQLPPIPRVEHAVDYRVRERWMHEKQRPRFTPFAETQLWFHIDSVRPADANGRRLHLMVMATPRELVTITTGSDGQITQLSTRVPDTRRPPVLLPGDSARFTRFRYFREGRLTMPEARLWDLALPVRVSEARVGARWTDTLARSAEHDGFSHQLSGVRVTTVVGDTTVGGKRFWVLRDSARVRQEQRWVEEERTLDTTVALVRTAVGTIRGRYVYDPELRLVVMRADTTRLTGETVLRYPESYTGTRVLRTPARYEAYRQWDLYDPAAFASRVSAQREAVQREQRGMVVVPTTDLERRLARGDRPTLDSLFGVWRALEDPNERERLFRTLIQWGSRDRQFIDRLDSTRVASGDTAYLHRWLARRAYGNGSADTTDMRRMIRFLTNPGLLFAYGESREALLENLRQGLTSSPPAVTRDTARWSCTPAACRMLAAQWRTATEPRLRDVALVALMALEPRTWADSVIARARAGSHFLEPAAMLARGVGAHWPAASKAPIPEPNAEWQTWAEWMSGMDPKYVASMAAARASFGQPPPRPEPRVRFEGSHANAIRFYAARTGRDVVGELRRQLDGATSDSARLVFGAMLQGLRELTLGPDEIAARFRSGRLGDREIATRALYELFPAGASVADSATTVTMKDRLVALVVDGTPAWRALSGGPAAWATRAPTLHSNPSRGPHYLLADSTPAVLRETWRARLGIITADEWARQPLTQGGVLYTLWSVKRVGPFVLVGVGTSERIARNPGDAPQVYAAGVQYYLMEHNGEWVVVLANDWVT